MAISEFDNISAVTISSSEISILSGTTSLSPSTSAGAYQLIIDASTMAKADEFRVRIYEKCLSGGTQRVLAQWTMLGAQSELFVTPTFMLLQGWDMTIIKIAGTDRAFTASVRKAG